ncbi:hypothetical protein COCHEDRAFT_1022865, partial [Bipolaris maydis C5]
MHIKPANLHISYEHTGRPEEKVSRYTGRPGTRGLTLVTSQLFLTLRLPTAYLSI